ncbi:PadR family transcriptional regulator [Gaopeijia maritima]|uniref:PadR family transcriptional regulator n=1 Tax=Gaopeijia maritima TaxID=3119007 RepID=A0ABU9EDI6_9BACT
MTASPLTPLSLHILLSLVPSSSHGYGILKRIEERFGGGEAPSTGALYLALQRLEREGLIELDPSPPAEADARRRYWALTPGGREAARAELDRMELLLADEAVRLLRGGGRGV